MSPILELSGVSKRFGALLAIDNLSMDLNAYEYLESNEQFGKFVIQVS
jgi:ABC-type branched-subunit amino acid transport system ATPase component